MSFKSILGTLNNAFVEKMHVKNEVHFMEDDYSVSQILDPATGKFYIKNNNSGDSMIGFNNDGTLRSDSALYTHVENKVNPVSRTVSDHTASIADHESRLSVVEQDPSQYTTVDGTLNASTTATLATVAIPNNKIGTI